MRPPPPRNSPATHRPLEPAMSQQHELSAQELLAAYRNKTLSPVEATRSVLDHIARWEPPVSYTHLDVSKRQGLLRALIRHQVRDAAIGLIVDPEAALAAHRAGVGKTCLLYTSRCV